MNLNHKLIKIAFILFYALSILLVPTESMGESNVIPTIDGDGPEINGNLTTEWQDSLRFDTTVNGENANIFVQVNGENVFIGLNYTSASPFIAVNDTIPTGSTTNYNNATHDWLVLQFDNNLDQEERGTSVSPDDVLVIDQFRNETYDGFINGSSTLPFIRDDNATIGGTDDGTAFRSNFSEFEFINDLDLDTKEVFQNVYEFSKPLVSNDLNGSDINAFQTNVLQFKIVYWMNDTSNATLATSTSTEWFTVRLDDTGTGMSTKMLNETRLDLLISDADKDNFNAFSTIVDQYGFDLATASNSTFFDPTANDLSVVLVGSDTTLSTADLTNMIDDVRIGGSLLIVLDNDSSVSQAIAEIFGLTYLSNLLIRPGTDENDTIFDLSLTATDVLPFVSGNSSVTGKTISAFNVKTSAFNITGLLDKTDQPFVLSQEYELYNLFDLPTDVVYDVNGDGKVDANDTNNGVSAGVAIDLLKGGRVTLLPSSDYFTNNDLTQSNFLNYLLRLLPWNAKLTNSLQVESITINTRNIERGGKISLSLNITDTFGNNFNDSVVMNVTSNLILGGNIVSTTQLSGSGSTYSGELAITRTGFMKIETVVFLPGYGFVEAEKLDIVSELSVNNFNDLDQLSFILAILFVATLAIVVLVYSKTK